MLKVVIIGGGLAGFSAAIGMALSGHAVTLLEAQEELKELGAGIQLMPNFTKIMATWSLLDQVRTKATQPKYLCFHSYRGGAVLHRYFVDPEMERVYGFPYLNIHRRDLLTVLIEKARGLGVWIELASSVSHLDVDQPSVTTSQGKPYTADLIIGADGERSFIRSILLHRPCLPKPTGKLVYRLSVDLEKVHADSALHELFKPSSVHLWLGPSSHVVAYDILSRGIVNIALTSPDPIAGRGLVGPRKANVHDLKNLFLGWDPLLVRLMEMATEASFWTLLQLPQQNCQWVDAGFHRVVLIGDAAHSMTPHLAQGAAQAVEDGAFLGHLFDPTIGSSDVPARLACFCERRQPRTLEIRSKAQATGALYDLPDGEAQEDRDNQMRKGELCGGFPNAIADPFLSHWLYDYDVETDAKSS